jgi:hypothetical protein
VKPHDYRDLIAAYIDVNYGPRGIVVYTEVSLGKTIIGKNRQLDVFALREADEQVERGAHPAGAESDAIEEQAAVEGKPLQGDG